jgi:hypothetical protein
MHCPLSVDSCQGMQRKGNRNQGVGVLVPYLASGYDNNANFRFQIPNSRTHSEDRSIARKSFRGGKKFVDSSTPTWALELFWRILFLPIACF